MPSDPDERQRSTRDDLPPGSITDDVDVVEPTAPYEEQQLEPEVEDFDPRPT